MEYKRPIPVGVSARHCHLSAADLATMFGEGHALTPLYPLAQPGQYAAAETVTVRTQHGEIPGVRVLGPTRSMTQLEISLTDARRLGLLVPVRVSAPGGAGGVTLLGPQGEVALAEGAVASMRHIHMNPGDAAGYGVVDGDIVKVQVLSGRGLVFDNVVVRVNPDYTLEFHVDTDEANASGLRNEDQVMLIHPFRVPAGPCVGCPLARGGV